MINNEKDYLKEIEHYTYVWSQGNIGSLYDLNNGICDNIIQMLGVEYYPQEYLFDIFRKWPHYSGIVRFPVPDPGNEFSAEVMYRIARSKWSGDYGRLRMNLCNFISEEIKTLLNGGQFNE